MLNERSEKSLINGQQRSRAATRKVILTLFGTRLDWLFVWRGVSGEARKRIEAAQLPPGSPSDYRNVEVVALGSDAAVVTYERPAPGQANAAAGEAQIFRGTAVFTRTNDGWKIAAWHAHSVSEKSNPH